MDGPSQQNLETRRNRLLTSISLLLITFAGSLVSLSFLDPELTALLNVTPGAARAGFFALTVALIALFWEKEREYHRVASELQREKVLGTAFRSRLEVLEALVRAGERLHAPVAVDEVLAVLLDASLELAGAVGGTAQITDSDASDLKIEKTIAPEGWLEEDLTEVVLPLESEGERIAVLRLFVPAAPVRQREIAVDVLERFAGQAAATLGRARLCTRDRVALDHLRASQVVKSRFLATVSHELRTPLTSILGFAQTLDTHWSRLEDERKVQAVQAIRGESHRLWRIVERMLDAVQVELQGVSIEPRDQDVRLTIRSGLRSFIESEPSRLGCLLPTDEVRAQVDPFVIDRVVTNLVDNALRYTDGTATLVLHPHDEEIVFRVQDEGPGMDPSQLSMVTQPLFRVEENVKSGTGLGLHVVRTLVAEHGGRFDITSDATGTVVTVRLPRWARASRQEPERAERAS